MAINVITEDRASGAQVIDGSLKFENDKSTHLTRTPGSAGDRDNYTGSVWVKRTEFAPENNSNSNAYNYTIFSAGTNSANNMDNIKFYKNAGTDDANKIEYGSYTGSYQYLIYTNAKYRDPNAWYNIVWNYNGVTAKLYVNGEEITSFDTNTQNGGSSGHFNNNVEHVIGHTCDQSNSSQFDGFMSQFYWIDGLALGPGYFGFTDPLTGTWRPKKLRQGDPTVNDGTVWSSGIPGNVLSGYPATNGFDGSTSTYVYADNNSTMTWTAPKRITGQLIEVYVYAGNTHPIVLVNGKSTGAVVGEAAQQGVWVDVTDLCGGPGGRLETITAFGQNIGGVNRSSGWSAVRVDGVILQDSTTTNLDFGTNGFYLPMDGNSPIGKDKSGKGNDWTPVNFGGSNALDKATGALPILNTMNGGNVATVDTRPDGVNYSSNTTASGGFNSSYPKTNLFDGRSPADSNRAEANSNDDAIDITFSPAINVSSTISLWSGKSSTRYQINNSGSYTTYSDAVGSYKDISHSGTLTNLKILHGSAGQAAGISAIKIDGTQLVDNNGLVLALPLIGNANDVSNQINSGSTTNTITNSEVDFVNTYSNFYGGSADFTGASTDVLYTASDNTKYQMGTGDFTVECWVYSTSTSGTQNIFQVFKSGGNKYYGVYYSSTLRFQIAGTGGVEVNVGNIVMGTNKWTHIAMVRDGGTLRAFVDGVQVGSGSVSADINEDGYVAYIGRHQPSNNGFTGYMQDFRIYKGVAKYTSNFIPASTNPDILPVTPSGVSGESKLTKITDGAVTFDGTGDYLDLPTSTDFGLASGDDFTIECFTYAKSYTGGSSYSEIIRQGTNNAGSDGVYFNINSSGTVEFRMSGTTKTTSGKVNIGAWNHIAVSRSSGTVYISINGVVENFGSVTNSSTTGDFRIGANFETNTFYEGQLSNVRFIKGTALYTSDFTPPSAPLTNVTNTKLLTCQSTTSNPGTASYDDAVLIMPMNGTNNGTTFTDISASSHTPSSVAGNTKTSTTQSKFYGSSGYFDGTGDYLDMGDSDDWVPQLGWTVEMWVYITGGTNSQRSIISQSGSGASNQSFQFLIQSTNKFACSIRYTGTNWADVNSNSAIPENQWVHLAVVIESGGTVKMYVDGTAQTETATFSGSGYNTSEEMWIGGQAHPSYPAYFTGYMNDVAIYQTAKYTSNFTPTTTGLLSSAPSMPAVVSPGTVSIKGNAAATNFNPFNTDITDINTIRGQETGYATLNPLHRNPNGNTTSNGNLTQTTSAGNGHYRANFAIGASSGKFYFEYQPTGGAVSGMVGLCEQTHAGSNNLNGAKAYSYYGVTGYKQGSPSAVDSAYGATYTFGDVVGVAFDSDNNTLEFFKNGISQGVAFTSFPNYPYYPAFSAGSSSNTVTYNVNFGQKPFKFPPPDGFQPLSLSSIRPETVIARPDQYVGVATHTGTGSAQKISLPFQADLIWTKTRSHSVDHKLVDSVRGLTKVQEPNNARVDSTVTNGVTGTTFNGFTIGDSGDYNTSGRTYVSWCWKAGGSKNTFNVDDVGYASAAAAGLTAGTITPDGASVGTKQGFSIVKFPGNETAGAKVPHGLSQTPDFTIVKQISGTEESWRVRHSSVNSTKTLYLNQSVGETSNTEYISGADSTTITLSTGLNGINGDNDYIMYAWHNVPGLQKFGKYSSNQNADGPFIELGFRPAMVWVKGIGSGSTSWRIFDKERNPFNTTTTLYLRPNVSNGDLDDTRPIDIVSNGFKIRVAGGGDINLSSGAYDYVYCAWAEAPDLGLYGSQSNAR